MEQETASEEIVPVDLDAPFKPNRPDVIDEEFEGEAVLVNLQTGCYFALNDAATAIWRAFGDGRSARALATGLGVEEPSVAEFLGRLLSEELIETAELDAGAADLEQIEPGGAAPDFQRFTDMQDLLMLDPIHDIDLDGDGWPVAAQAE